MEGFGVLLCYSSGYILTRPNFFASYFGKTEIISLLITAGADVNGHGMPEDFGGFHAHASPLYQPVSSGSLKAVELLVKEGADLHATEQIF